MKIVKDTEKEIQDLKDKLRRTKDELEKYKIKDEIKELEYIRAVYKNKIAILTK